MSAVRFEQTLQHHRRPLAPHAIRPRPSASAQDRMRYQAIRTRRLSVPISDSQHQLTAVGRCAVYDRGSQLSRYRVASTEHILRCNPIGDSHGSPRLLQLPLQAGQHGEQRRSETRAWSKDLTTPPLATTSGKKSPQEATTKSMGKWINDQLTGRSCAVVLIGRHTAGRTVDRIRDQGSMGRRQGPSRHPHTRVEKRGWTPGDER